MGLTLVTRTHRGHTATASERELRSPPVHQIDDVHREVSRSAGNSLTMRYSVERLQQLWILGNELFDIVEALAG
jgi:hypothetical protein